MKIYRIQPIYFDLTRIKKYILIHHTFLDLLAHGTTGSVGSNLTSDIWFLLKFTSLFLIHTTLL